MVAGSPMSSRKTVTSMSSEKRLIRPKPLDNDVPPLNSRRGPPSFRPWNKASSVQHTQKSFSIFWDTVPRRSAVVSKALNIVSVPAARTSSKARFMFSSPCPAWLIAAFWLGPGCPLTGRRQRDDDHHDPNQYDHHQQHSQHRRADLGH